MSYGFTPAPTATSTTRRPPDKPCATTAGPATGFASDLAPAILEQARRGDCAALESIYRQFDRAVFTLARRISGCPDRAADVLQNTFLRAFDVLHQFRGDAPFGHWLRSICAREALMQLRSERRMEPLEDADQHSDAAPGPDVLCQADLEHALALLPPLTRAVLWLYHVEGYTHAQIADHCGKTTSFSKSQLNRAHQRLRELLVEPGVQTAAQSVTQTVTDPHNPCKPDAARASWRAPAV